MEPNALQADQPIVNIARDLVALGPLRRDLIQVYLRWYNDFAAMMPYLLQLRPRTRDAQEAMFEASAKPDSLLGIFHDL
jgi:hypothetical protein